MNLDFDTPLRPTRLAGLLSPCSPVSSAKGLANDTGPYSPSPKQVLGDRYIPIRESQDNSLSRFLLISKENLSPVVALSQHGSSWRENSAMTTSVPPVRTSTSPLTNMWVHPHQSSSSQREDNSVPRNSPYRHISHSRIDSSQAGSPPVSSSVVEAFTHLRQDSLGHIVHPGSGLTLTPPSAMTPAYDAGTPGEGPMTSDAMLTEVEPYTTRLLRNLFSDTVQGSVLGIHSPSAPNTEDRCAADCGRVGLVGCRSAKTTYFREQERFSTSLGVVYETNRTVNFTSKSFRVISQTPERILDAADMIDDFYMNLMDWSTKGILAVAIQSSMYLWDSTTCTITQLVPHTTDNTSITSDLVLPTADKLICSVSWVPDGQHLAIGLNDGCVDVWDAETKQVVRSWHKHSRRVGSLNWTNDGKVLASGSKDATIRLQDLREGSEAIHILRVHTQEICGLRYSPHRNNIYLASGGNDNQLLVWDRRLLRGAGEYNSAAPDALPVLYLNQHKAAVKAIAWHPVQSSLLASGGGTDDKTLRFWNTLTGECIRHHNTHSQVCGVLWNHAGTELVSSHGFSKNQLSIWKYPSLRHVVDLTGHTSRVLHLCLSPDGATIASAAGDETIRFWRCFPPSSATDRFSVSSPSSLASVPSTLPSPASGCTDYWASRATRVADSVRYRDHPAVFQQAGFR